MMTVLLSGDGVIEPAIAFLSLGDFGADRPCRIGSRKDAWTSNCSSVCVQRPSPMLPGEPTASLRARFDGVRLTDVALTARVTNPSWVTATRDGAFVYSTRLYHARRQVSFGGCGRAVAPHPTGKPRLCSTLADSELTGRNAKRCNS